MAIERECTSEAAKQTIDGKGMTENTHPRRPDPLCACWKNILLPRRVKAKQRDTKKESGPSSTCRETLQCVHVCGTPSLPLFLFSFVCLYIHPSVYLSVSVSLSVCLSVCVSVCLSI